MVSSLVSHYASVPDHLWVRALLAISVYQSILQWLTHRNREQARTHMGSSMGTHSASGSDPLWERALFAIAIYQSIL